MRDRLRRRQARVRSRRVRGVVQPWARRVRACVRRHAERSTSLRSVRYRVRRRRALLSGGLYVPVRQGALRRRVRRAPRGPTRLRGLRDDVQRRHPLVRSRRLRSVVLGEPHRLQRRLRGCRLGPVELRRLRSSVPARRGLRRRGVRVSARTAALRGDVHGHERGSLELRRLRERLLGGPGVPRGWMRERVRGEPRALRPLVRRRDDGHGGLRWMRKGVHPRVRLRRGDVPLPTPPVRVRWGLHEPRDQPRSLRLVHEQMRPPQRLLVGQVPVLVLARYALRRGVRRRRVERGELRDVRARLQRGYDVRERLVSSRALTRETRDGARIIE